MSIKVSNRIIWTLFFVAIAGLLVLQTVWTYNLYQSKKQDLREQIQNILGISIEKEITIRVNQHKIDHPDNVAQSINSDDYAKALSNTPPKPPEDSTLIIGSGDVLESGLFQILMDFAGYKFQIDTLDRLFHNELQKADIDVVYNICYRDSNGVILEQRGNSQLLNDKNVFHSDSLLIVNGQRIQAFVDIAIPAVIKNMIWVLVLSVLLIIAIGFIAYILTKKLLTEQRLNQLRNDFVQAFSHNMKTPLGGAQSAIAVLMDPRTNNFPEKKQSIGETGMSLLDNVLKQIERMLTLEKLESNKLKPELQRTNLRTMIDKIQNMYSNDKEVIIKTFFEIPDDWFCVDEFLLSDAIRNLIENSIKYSQKPVEINIHCYIVNKQLYISVKDNGFGIDQKYHDIIFNKFERGDAVSRKGARGFGLGLNFVKRVALAHNGEVKLFSEINQGSEFTIIVPATVKEQKEL